jgi:glycosyltransferase involved in cell wall biosynthesis
MHEGLAKAREIIRKKRASRQPAHQEQAWADSFSDGITLLETRLRKSPGVIHHGKISQPELWRQYLQSGIWLYPTLFRETSCTTSMEAQALGAIPIYNPIHGLKETVQYGQAIPIENDHFSRAALNEYKEAVLSWIRDPEKQTEVRAEMIRWARYIYHWDRTVELYDRWIKEDMETVLSKTKKVKSHVVRA